MTKKSVLTDRRGYTRLEAKVKVVLRVGSGEKVLGELLDLALGGVRLRAPLLLEAGDRVELTSVSHSRAEPAFFRVVWSRPTTNDWNQAGLHYEGSATDFLRCWVAQLFSRAGGDVEHLVERRRFVRLPLESTIGIQLNGNVFQGSLLDIGGGGALFLSQADLPIGRYAKLHLPEPKLELDGTIVQKRREDDTWLYSMNFTPHSQDDQVLGEFLRSL